MGLFWLLSGGEQKIESLYPRDIFDDLPGGDELIRGKKPIAPEEFEQISAKLTEKYPGGLYGYNPPKCGGCLRACLANLEKKGTLSKKFRNPFRTSKPWNLDRTYTHQEPKK